MQWAEDLTRSEDAARWICGIFFYFPCLSLLYSNCFCNFSINSIAVGMLVCCDFACVDFAWILLGCVVFAWIGCVLSTCFIGKMPTVPNGHKQQATVTFWVLALWPKPVGMAPEIGRGIMPLHLPLPVGVTNLIKRGKICLCLLGCLSRWTCPKCISKLTSAMTRKCLREILKLLRLEFAVFLSL